LQWGALDGVQKRLVGAKPVAEGKGGKKEKRERWHVLTGKPWERGTRQKEIFYETRSILPRESG